MSEQVGAMNYERLAQGIDELRETLRGMVAAVMAEGFCEEHAREIVTAIFRSGGEGDS